MESNVLAHDDRAARVIFLNKACSPLATHEYSPRPIIGFGCRCDDA